MIKLFYKPAICLTEINLYFFAVIIRIYLRYVLIINTLMSFIRTMVNVESSNKLNNMDIAYF